MALYDLRKADFAFEDARGCLTQLVHEGFAQVNVLFTREGVIRGGHYHKICDEAFYIINGSVETTLRKTGESETEVVTFSRGDFFAIHQDTVHSMYFPEDCLMVQLYSIPVEQPDGSKDIIPEEI